jgi:hypothetical protein
MLKTAEGVAPAASPEAYIEAVDEPKRGELRQLDALIRRCLPGIEPRVAGGMLGYGPFHYRYKSGHEGDAFRVGLAANKTGISVYVLAVDENGYLAEQGRERLGKANVGKSCIRFKRLSDIHVDVLEEVLLKAARLPAPGEVPG